MIISGVAELHPEVRCRLYTPYRDAAFKTYFDAYPNVTVVEPEVQIGSNSIWRSYSVAKVIRDDGVDLFHGLSHELPHGLPADLPALVTMHDMAVWRFPQFFPLVDRAVYRKKQKAACDRADRIIAVSKQTKSDLVEILGVPEEKICVVYQSCHPQFWNPVPLEEQQRVNAKYKLPEKYALCVGTVEERKNQLMVVKALAELPELNLVIVGKQKPYARQVKEEIVRNGLEKKVMMLEGVDFADLPGLYSGALFSVYMSVFEGFGIPVLESMCCGTPVVCSNVSSLPEVGGEAALLADPQDVDGIAEAMNRLAFDPGLRQDRKDMSLAQAAHFSKGKVIGDLFEVYSQFSRS
ncbi:MAG: glycosyltransferase family 4 protein [Bacteroidales bacterium]|nr:glycosyltransferase family 4 protein [Bacteroidales bacterium]